MGGVAPGHRRPSHLIEIGEKLYARSFEIDPIERPLQAHALTSPVTVGAEALEDRAPP